jgi:hypothetical protein
MTISFTALTKSASQAYVIFRYLSDLRRAVGPEAYERHPLLLEHGPGSGFGGVGNTGSSDCAKERVRGITDSLGLTWRERDWRSIYFASQTCVGIARADFRRVGGLHRVEHTREVMDLYRALEQRFIISGVPFTANDLAAFVVRNQVVCLIQRTEQRKGHRFDEAAPFSKYSAKIFYCGEDISRFNNAQLLNINAVRYGDLLTRLGNHDFGRETQMCAARLNARGDRHTLPPLEEALECEDPFDLLVKHYPHKVAKLIQANGRWFDDSFARRHDAWLNAKPKKERLK